MTHMGRRKIKEQYHTDKRQVFCIGCKGIPAKYGGFETFVENLTLCRKSDKIRYHVATIAREDSRYQYNGAKCYNVKVPEIGPAKAVVYDIKALDRAIRYCEERPAIDKPIFFIMACRIGIVIKHYKKKIEKLGGRLYINPDGHDWERRKWSAPVRMYWKLSERLMIKHADRIICDSKEIEKYINKEYSAYNPSTTFIAYGADLERSTYADNDFKFTEWLAEQETKPFEYYLVVGRFVKENNFDIIIKEFLKSSSDKKLIIITTENDKLLQEFDDRLHFLDSGRVTVADSVYDKQLLKKIRENAYAYIHGHEVGGTNPSLLEALASTDVNFVLDVSYNHEVAEDAAIYWDKDGRDLSDVINANDKMQQDRRAEYSNLAKTRISDEYTWESIAQKYENEFLA